MSRSKDLFQEMKYDEYNRQAKEYQREKDEYLFESEVNCKRIASNRKVISVHTIHSKNLEIKE